MHFQKGSVNVLPEALLESLGQGLFNSPDAHQIEVLSELDFLNGFATIRSLVRKKVSWAVPIFNSLLNLDEGPLAATLLEALTTDKEINTNKLNLLLSKKKKGLTPILERLSVIQPLKMDGTEIELKYLRHALLDTVHDYKETKVGCNLMNVCFLMPRETRLSIWNELQAVELYSLSTYIKSPQHYSQFIVEVPSKKLPGFVHEMSKGEQLNLLAWMLQSPDRDLNCLKQALKGLYHMADGVGEVSEVLSLSDQGRLLRKVLDREGLSIPSISPDKLAHVVSILLKDEEDKGICTIFKQKTLTEKQVLAIDGHFEKEGKSTGCGLKYLIETIHDHEGVFSLSSTTSKAYPIMQELKRLGLDELLLVCQKARL